MGKRARGNRKLQEEEDSGEEWDLPDCWSQLPEKYNIVLSRLVWLGAPKAPWQRSAVPRGSLLICKKYLPSGFHLPHHFAGPHESCQAHGPLPGD